MEDHKALHFYILTEKYIIHTYIYIVLKSRLRQNIRYNKNILFSLRMNIQPQLGMGLSAKVRYKDIFNFSISLVIQL